MRYAMTAIAAARGTTMPAATATARDALNASGMRQGSAWDRALILTRRWRWG
jgi:hypothetical protein